MIPVLLMPAYPPWPADPGGRLRASDADRDLAVDILCAAVGDGRLTLAELDERVGAALSARTIGELAALIADLSGPWTPVPASASVRVSPPASPGWASRAPERWSLLQSLAGRPVLPGQLVPVSRDSVQQRPGILYVAPTHVRCSRSLACWPWKNMPVAAGNDSCTPGG